MQERVDNKENEVRVGIKRGMVVEEEKVEDSEIQSKRVKAESNRLSLCLNQVTVASLEWPQSIK